MQRSWTVVVFVVFAFVGCGSSALRLDPSESAACTCAAGQKFDGSTCMAPADFQAPTCTSDGVAVCGCDSQDYASSCDAFGQGVQIAFSGACRPPASAPARGFGW